MRIKINTRTRDALRAATVIVACALTAGGLTMVSITAADARNPDTTPRPVGTITVRPPTPLPSATGKPAAPAKVITPRQVAHALRYCGRLADEYQAPCIALYLRDAQTKTNPSGSVVSNPAGPALAAECADSPVKVYCTPVRPVPEPDPQPVPKFAPTCE